MLSGSWPQAEGSPASGLSCRCLSVSRVPLGTSQRGTLGVRRLGCQMFSTRKRVVVLVVAADPELKPTALVAAFRHTVEDPVAARGPPQSSR